MKSSKLTELNNKLSTGNLSSIDIVNILSNNEDILYTGFLNKFFYRSDCVYVKNRDTFIPKDELFQCGLTKQFYHTSDKALYNAYYKGKEIEVCKDSIKQYNLYVPDDDSRLYNINDLYMSDSNVLYTEPQENYKENNDYHSSLLIDLSNGSKSKIGFEVEKEDEYLKEVTFGEVFNRSLWGKESDGSLDDDCGFELVSPIYDLNKPVEYFAEEFLKNEDLINAEYTINCGGHIHYSCDGFNGSELLDSIYGYVPLLYALYNHRLDMSYSRAKGKERLKSERDKYQSINVLSDRLEFRIFSAVKNVQQLLWRTRLIKYIDHYKTAHPLEVLDMVTDKSNELHLLLTEVYNHKQIINKIHLMSDLLYKYDDQHLSSARVFDSLLNISES